ncbi:MAG: DUF2156 domain-containing protein [Clostridia bacterium]|nr:DUF2156 domain-containing protein [Clostridia bacterium]
MLEFRKITLEDKPLLDKILKNAKEVSCENTFVNLYVWQDAYDTEIAFKDGNLFIRYGKGESISYRLPIGGNLEDGLKEIFAISDTAPVFWNPINEAFSSFPKWFAEKYDIIQSRDSFDYIYRQSDLANLEGKKYHSKRNHISAFSKKYDWHYEEINPANLDKIITCADAWYSENAERLDEFALVEKKGLKTVLENLELFSVKGGAIFIDDKAIAFTLGTPINNKIFDVFAEKALPEFATAYTVINNCFAKELGDFKYINREDDMGLEGLRRAKLSYRPAVLLEKYIFKPNTATDKV